MTDLSPASMEEKMLQKLQKGKHSENEVGTAVADRNGLLIQGSGTLKESSQDIHKYNDVTVAAMCTELLNIARRFEPDSKLAAVVLEGDTDKIIVKSNEQQTVAISHVRHSSN